jgi:hypothetical protein
LQPNYTVMTVAVLADEMLKQEINDRGAGPDVRMIWADSLRSLTIIEADVYMDLLFDMDRERISSPATVAAQTCYRECCGAHHEGKLVWM